MKLAVYAFIVALVGASAPDAELDEPVKYKYLCQATPTVDTYTEEGETDFDQSNMVRVYPTDKQLGLQVKEETSLAGNTAPAAEDDKVQPPVGFTRQMKYKCVREEIPKFREFSVLAIVSFSLLGAVALGAIVMFCCCAEKKKDDHSHGDEEHHDHEGGDFHHML